MPLTFSKLRDNVLGDKSKTLNNFVYKVGVKYRREAFSNSRNPEGFARLAIFVSLLERRCTLNGSHTQNLIQRRFAYEHPELLIRQEPEDPGLQSDSDHQTSPPSKKRKRGRPTAVEHFWAQVDKWFKEKHEEWGPFTSEPWKLYVVLSLYLSARS